MSRGRTNTQEQFDENDDLPRVSILLAAYKWAVSNKDSVPYLLLEEFFEYITDLSGKNNRLLQRKAICSCLN